MSAAAAAVNGGEKKPTASVSVYDKPVQYKPIGSDSEIVLTVATVKRFLVQPTRTGKYPDDAEVIRFMMLCKSSALNPWVGDAYLTGYDTQDGPKFSLITGVGAMLKRAELNPEFDGLESGVIVVSALAKEGVPVEPIYRDGSLVLPTERLIGGWSRVLRKDRKIPFYEALDLATYDTRKSRWGKDPAGMIVKCARAAVLRMAFPNQLAGVYASEEFDSIESRAHQAAISQESQPKARISSKEDLIDRFQPAAAQPEPVIVSAPVNETTVVSDAVSDVIDGYECDIADPDLQNEDSLRQLEVEISSDKRLSDTQKRSLVAKIRRQQVS